MDNDLEWLRAAAPPTIEPSELALRRARGRLVAEIERSAAHRSHASHDPLRLRDLPTLELRPRPYSRARADETGHVSRRVVFGGLAAGVALLVVISIVAGGGGRYKRPLDTAAADAGGAGTGRVPVTAVPSTQPSRTEAPTAAPRGPVPSLVIDQVFQLVDGQPVTITVFNVPEARTLEIELCPMSTEPDVDCPDLGTHELDGSDKQSITVAIPRFTIHPTTGDVADCVEPCIIRVRASSVTAYARLSFKPDGDLAPAPTLQIDTRPEGPGDRVTVTGDSFPNYSSSTQYLQAHICAAEPAELSNTLELIAGCGLPSGTLWETEPELDGEGRFRAVLVAPGDVTTARTREIRNCFTDSCWLVISTGGLTAGPAFASVQLT